MDRQEFYEKISDAVGAIYEDDDQTIHIIKGILIMEVLIDDREVRQVIVVDLGIEVLPWEMAGFAEALAVRARVRLSESMHGPEDAEEEENDD